MKQHYLTLDALRGIAAVLVVARHIEALAPGNPFPASYLAVDFFFGLSGFVLAYAYADRLVPGGMTFGKFALARLIRLYPLYLAAGLLAILTIILKVIVGASEISDLMVGFANLVFIPIPAGSWIWALYPLNAPGWSLAFELFINAVFALIVFRLTNWRLAILLVVSAIVLTAAGLRYGDFDIGAHWKDAWAGFPRVTFSFFMGVAIFRLHRAYPLRLPSWVLIPICLALMASFVPAVPVQGAYDAVATLVIFPALLYLGASVTPPAPLRGTCEFLGAISYAIYVLHAPIRDVVLAVFHYVPVTPSWWVGAAFMVMVLAASWIADKIYDIPVRKWLTAKLLRTGGRPTAGPTVVVAQPERSDA